MAKRKTGAKRHEDLRIPGATPEALAESLFEGAPKRPETRPKPRGASD